MDRLDLELIYEQLKEQYDIKLTTGLALDAGFDWDVEVLTGTSRLGTFYLYHNGVNAILDYSTKEGIANRHWHPSSTAEAMNYVIDFMEERIV